MFRYTVFFFLLFSNLQLTAQWSSNPALNNAVSVEVNDQRNPQMVSDGNNGAIICWEDSRNGFDFKLYAQRVDANGNNLWAANGVILCGDGQNQFRPKMVSDGAGGAIIVFEDGRNGFNNDIWAQRIDGNGNILWTSAGAPVCLAANFQYYPELTSDGSGGAIVTWYDNRGGNSKVYAQRINSAGVSQWTSNGVAVSNITHQQEYPKIVSDGANGAVISWRDRTGPGVQVAMYAQHLNAAGVIQWAVSGNTICTNTSDPASLPDMCSDGSGGAIIVWEDYRSIVYHVYAQRISNNGIVQWIADGVQLTNAPNWQINPRVINDGGTGAFITWNDGRTGNGEAYAQHIDASGTALWAANGIDVCALVNNQYFSPQIFTDNSGGAIIGWQDLRGADANVYAQHLDASGTAQWAINGALVCSAAGGQGVPSLVYNNSNSTTIAAWTDFRNGNADIYASRLLANGTLPLRLLSFSGQQKDKKNFLYWKTTDEINTKYFFIERSIDGTVYLPVGNVNAKAGGNRVNEYSFIDAAPPPGKTYYRLKMVDADGRFTYSSVVFIKTTPDNSSFHIFPDPADQYTNLEWNGAQSGLIDIQVINQSGAVVKKIRLQVAPQMRLNTADLPTGYYHVMIKKDGITSSAKLFISH